MDISPEIVARMEAFVRAIDDVPRDSVLGQSRYASEARAIVALLPKPVDPDLLEAREIVAVGFEKRFRDYGRETHGPERAREGCYDGNVVADCLAAIKRGRELAAKDAS